MDDPEFDIVPFLSEEALNRSRIDAQLSNLIMKFAGQSDVVGMHGGLPSPDLFPIQGLSLDCVVPETADEHTSTPGAHKEPPDSGTEAIGPKTIRIGASEEVTSMQQYNLNMQGHKKLREWLRALIYCTQRPARADLDLILVPSCNASLDAFFHMLLNPSDPVLVEEYMYCAPLDVAILPRNCKPYAVAMDMHGMRADDLEDTIQRCMHDTDQAPKLLYLVPNCQNPTGRTMTMQRKKDIYKVCQKHNIVILEDDPYALLQFPHDFEEDMHGLDVEPGFLSVDTDGRVIRVDSFSKVMAPGLRLAWVTATPKTIVHCLNASFGPTLGPAPLSQGVAYSLLQSWGFQGFEFYIKRLQAAYYDRAKKLAAAVEGACGDRVSVRRPCGGMFLWVEFRTVEDTEDLVDLMTKHKVALVPGKYFSPNGKDADFKCKFARLAYSFLCPEKFDEGARRLACMLEEYESQNNDTSQPITAAEDTPAADGKQQEVTLKPAGAAA